MHPAIAALLLVTLLVVLVKFVPVLIRTLEFVAYLKQQGYSNQRIGEILQSEGRRLTALGEAMARGCGDACHERYCDLDPLGDQPHRCHRVDCREGETS